MLSWWKNELGKNKEDQAEEEDMAPVTDTPPAPAPPKKKVSWRQNTKLRVSTQMGKNN